MIPCRLFLQKCVIVPQNQNSKKLKIVLTLNSIFYEEIHPFQSKYFCLSSQDIIGVEVSTQDHDLILGCSTIQAPFRLALESEQVQIRFKAPFAHTQTFSEICLIFAFEPVSQFSKKKLGEMPKNINGNPVNELYNQNQEPNKQLQISFSHRDPLMETSRNAQIQIFNNTLGNLGNTTGRNNMPATNRSTVQVKESTLGMCEDSSESLESLAHQRQKLLGQLFGKLRRETRKNHAN